MKKIKTILLSTIGDKLTSVLQALRFVYLLIVRRNKISDPEMKISDMILEKGEVAIDIGANGANWTYHLYKKVGNAGEVYAFEADPYYARATKTAINIISMKSVKFFPFGLSDEIEYVPLRVESPDGLRYSGLGFVDKSAKNDDKGTVMVQLKPLDSLLNDYPKLLEAKLIKCDVEGYELFVFKGAVEIIKNAKPIIILEVGNYEKYGYDGSVIYKFFKKMNYTAFSLSKEGKLCPTDEYLDHKDALSVNRILLSDEKIKTFSRNLIDL